MRSVLCCHLLTSSEKLSKLYHAYETLGVSIISRIGLPLPSSPSLPAASPHLSVAGFLSSCDVCWRAVALARATTEYHPAVQELLWLAESKAASETAAAGSGQSALLLFSSA
jgi:hypothetical protein